LIFLIDKKFNNKFKFKNKSQAHCNIGYSPIITFNVPNFDLVINKLNIYDGIEFDGPLIKNEMGKVILNIIKQKLIIFRKLI